MDLSSWTGAPRPERIALEGTYVRLDPLSTLIGVSATVDATAQILSIERSSKRRT